MYDPHLHLFVDDLEVDASRNVTPTIGRPERRSHDPIVVSDQPYEGAGIGMDCSILPGEDGSGFRMWYRSLDAAREKTQQNLLHYAVSDDGHTWTKPVLGQIEVDGNTNNNVFHRPGLIPGCRAMESHGLIVDDVGGPQRRYKMPVYHSFHGDRDNGLFALFSPDGITWTQHPEPIYAQAGDRHSAIKDPATGEYWLFLRPPRYHSPMGNGAPPGSGALPYKRIVSRATSQDFVHWSDYTTVLRNDAFDTRGTEFYNIAPIVYGNRYLAFVNLYDTDVERMWVTLASSLDGLHWHRPYRSERFLDLGAEGGWDDSWVNMSDSPPVRQGDRMRFWFHGREEAHGLNYRTGGIGTFVLGLDRFAGLSAGREAGWIVTDRVQAGANRLFLNANVRNGSARVEVRTSNGTPIPGLMLDDCDEIRGDSVEHPVTWNGSPDLGAAAGERVRVHIEFSYGQVFAYRFGDEARDLS